ncbi:unnamed protein product [Moneuplotes crassus]|uniref:Uncharacterized protein n=1 Tax=Euplotes crassus TaxID=5936 RepID=A0AAD1X298_EUPCR|nr:unnamed protein product [Moneuplotes crassus]
MLHGAYFRDSDEDEDIISGTSQDPLSITTGVPRAFKAKNDVLGHEIVKEIEFQKDHILSVYDTKTMALELCSPPVSKYFVMALDSLIESSLIQIRHLKISGASVGTCSKILTVITKHKRCPLTVDLKIKGKSSLKIGKNIGKLLKWKKNGDLRGIKETQILCLEDLQIDNPDILCAIFGKKIYKKGPICLVEELIMQDMGLTDETLQSFDEDSSNLFASFALLKHFSFSGNHLSIHGIHWITKGMIKTENLFLKKINLSRMGIASKGVKLFVQGLSNCKMLKHLDFRHNSIDDSAMADLCLLVDPYSSIRIKLTSLDLSYNRLTSVGCSRLLICYKSKKTKTMKKSTKPPRKCSLRQIDICGNKIDVGIINSFRAALESSRVLSQKEISSCIKKCLSADQEVKSMDLREIAYSVASKEMKNDSIPSIRFTLTKQRRNKQNDENKNSMNTREKVMDYSEKVREMNKKETLLNSKPSYYSKQRSCNSESAYSIEKSGLSDSTDNFVTSYQKYREIRSERVESAIKIQDRTERVAEDCDNISLDYSLSSSDDAQEETKTISSVSDYYSAGKSKFIEKVDQSTLDLASDFHRYKDQIENATIDKSSCGITDSVGNTLSEISESVDTQKEAIISNYNKLLKDIRGVIKTQRQNILQRTHQFESSSDSDY